MSFDKVFNSIIGESTRKFDYDKDIELYPLEYNEYPIDVTEEDEYHKYRTIDGVTYELSLDGVDKVVKISDVYETDGNTFYPDKIDAYQTYIEHGGIIQTLPVHEVKGGNIVRIDDMIETLIEMKDDVLGENGYDKYWEICRTINIDPDKVEELLELYYYPEKWDDEDKLVMSEFIDRIVKYFTLEHDEEPDKYYLRDHNHRFRALKRIGVEHIMVEVIG